MRSRSAREFSCIFIEATKLGKDLHGEEFELLMSRVNRQQVHHSNVEAQKTVFESQSTMSFSPMSLVNYKADLSTMLVTVLASTFFPVNAVALVRALIMMQVSLRSWQLQWLFMRMISSAVLCG